MADYRFLTTWLVEAPRERVWAEIEDAARWPEWWRGVVRVDELHPGHDGRVGARFEIEWRSRLPYPLAFEFTVDAVDPPRSMAGTARGELEGRGHWRLFEQDGVTAVVYDWQVSTTKRWMNLLAPLARPVFDYNHDVVMGWGGEGLARRPPAPCWPLARQPGGRSPDHRSGSAPREHGGGAHPITDRAPLLPQPGLVASEPLGGE